MPWPVLAIVSAVEIYLISRRHQQLVVQSCDEREKLRVFLSFPLSFWPRQMKSHGEAGASSQRFSANRTHTHTYTNEQQAANTEKSLKLNAFICVDVKVVETDVEGSCNYLLLCFVRSEIERVQEKTQRQGQDFRSLGARARSRRQMGWAVAGSCTCVAVAPLNTATPAAMVAVGFSGGG